jgi:type II secretory pathway pseudopilin PulG
LATDARPHVPALQVLIVVAIAALVVTLAIPAYAARARDTVLCENAKTLEFEVKSYLALDLEPTYVSDREADADAKLDVGRGASEVIANALGGYGGGVSAYFVNPTSGSRMVVCESDLSATPDGTPPAVWISDDKRYSYAAFVASSTTKDRLGGTLMLVFTTPGVRAGGIEVFYVDAEGERSATATTLAI